MMITNSPLQLAREQLRMSCMSEALSRLNALGSEENVCLADGGGGICVSGVFIIGDVSA